jgi:threonine aldolase
MAEFSRRNFLKASGLSVLPALLPAVPAFATGNSQKQLPAGGPMIKFYGDGEMFEPAAYIDQLQQINKAEPIGADRYGSGGAVAALEKKFTEITGKGKAVFMPSGTMANQMAIAVLGGANTKVFVQDTSHVYRDEADAAQSVFGKRLMPLAKGETFFTAAALQQAVEGLGEEEVFESGVGAVSIENPVRRTDGRMVPIDELRKISTYCRNKNIQLHLDGARIYMAAAWSGVSIKEYASLFDTVYISLYKYLGAAGGAVLCGDKAVIDKIPHLVKIHGGSMYGNWANAAMALHRLEGVEERLKAAKDRFTELVAAITKLPGITISSLPGGSNIYALELGKAINGDQFHTALKNDFNIRFPRPDADRKSHLTVNETLLYRDAAFVVEAFKKALAAAKA